MGELVRIKGQASLTTEPRVGSSDLLERACVRSVFLAPDQKLALQLYQRGVPVERVQRAIHLAEIAALVEDIFLKGICRPAAGGLTSSTVAGGVSVVGVN